MDAPRYRVRWPALAVVVGGVAGRPGRELVVRRDELTPEGVAPQRLERLEQLGALAPVEAPPVGPPPESALKADWVAYAVDQGMSADEARGATKGALVAKYAGDLARD